MSGEFDSFSCTSAMLPPMTSLRTWVLRANITLFISHFDYDFSYRQDSFGSTVAVNEDTVVVIIPTDILDVRAAHNFGSGNVYKLNTALTPLWTLQAKLVANDKRQN